MAASDSNSSNGQKPANRRRFKLALPTLVTSHLNAHDLKIFFRCWIAVWVAFLLIFIQPSLQEFGQATFFAALVLVIAPPATILFLYLLAAFTLLMGMCLAWCWGLVTMKAAFAARPDAEMQVLVQSLQERAVAAGRSSGQTPQWEAQILVHEGFLLDARVTAIFFAMGLVFIYFLARLRTANPKFTLLQIFGSIVTDIFLLFGPGIPTFTGDLPAILVKPGAAGIGIGVVCSLLFFPRSTSYVVLDTVQKLVALTDTSFDATRRRLKSDDLPLQHLKATRAKILALYKSSLPAVGFLPLDLSRGLWDAEDVQGLMGPVRDAMIASLSLFEFHISWVVTREKEERLRQHWQQYGSSPADEHRAGHREKTEGYYVVDALRTHDESAMHEEALSQLSCSLEELLEHCSRSLELSSRCIRTVNNLRWSMKRHNREFEEIATELQARLDALGPAKEQCMINTTEGILEAYADVFDEDGNLKSAWAKGPSYLRGLILTMVIEERILVASGRIEKLLAALLHLMQTRKTNRIWFPFKLKYAFSWAFTTRHSVPSQKAFGDIDDDPEKKPELIPAEDDSTVAYQRLKLTRGYTHVRPRNFLSRAIITTKDWLFGVNGVFALKLVVVTFVTAIPAVIPHSAGLFYREKGIWAVISAQTTMDIYMADFSFVVLARIVSTVIGGVLGMLAWYIGSGNGIGNPYGLAASSAVFLLIVIWLRLFLPPIYLKAVILGCATFVLVIGFSYDDRHIVQYGLPGRGYQAFWKRVVLVLIGFVAATIVQIIPSPPSATKHVQKVLSKSIRSLSDHYALLLSHWGREHSPLGAVAEQLAIGVAETLQSLDPSIALLSFEVSSGPFDKQSLQAVQARITALNQSLWRLLDLSSSLPKRFQDRLVEAFGITDQRIIGDVMAVLTIVEQALITGSPLPERMPSPLLRRFYDFWHAREQPLLVTVDLIRDDDYRRYCVAMSAYVRYLSTIDDLVVLLKECLGECHVLHEWDRDEKV